MLLLSLFGCHSDPAATKPAYENAHAPTATPQRIVSLAPSNTEILFALGLEKRIAGVTSQCDFPAEARQKPNVGGYPIAPERILALNPDLVVTVGSINTKETVALKNAGIAVLNVNPKTMPDVYAAIRTIGQATGATDAAATLVRKMQTQITSVEQVVSAAHKPKVLILHQAGPLYSTNPDSYIADAIRSAGGDYLVKSNLPGGVLASEQVLLDPPDVILCDASLVPQIKALPGWAAGIPAVRNNRFYTGTGDAPLVRPGPRLPQAIEDLARYLHPEPFAGKPRITLP